MINDLPIGPNSGHGHVWKRPDGRKMRCGGPGLCAACSVDYSLFHAKSDQLHLAGKPIVAAAQPLEKQPH